MYEILYSIVVVVSGFAIGYVLRSFVDKDDLPQYDDPEVCVCPYCGKKESVSAYAAYCIECPRCERITPAHDWLPVIRKGTD